MITEIGDLPSSNLTQQEALDALAQYGLSLILTVERFVQLCRSIYFRVSQNVQEAFDVQCCVCVCVNALTAHVTIKCGWLGTSC